MKRISRFRLLALLVTVCMLALEAPIVTSESAFDPMAKYDPEITITVVKRLQQGEKFMPGDSDSDNYWTRLYKDRLGINLEYLWMADASQYENKMNLAVASGDIPDLSYYVTAAQYGQMVKGGVLADMKPIIDKYMTPLTKEIMQSDGVSPAAEMTADGKMYFLPMNSQDIRANVFNLIIRKDWLENVGLTAPKTFDDFLKVCDAFVNGDPDKNNQKDTYALGVAGKDNLIIDWGSLRPFFEMYHVQPGAWWDNSLFYEKDNNGNVIWSGSKPQVKVALTQLNDMYNKGYLAQDFGTIDAGGKLAQDLANSKVGMFFGASWMSGWPLPDVLKNVPSADFVVVKPPTVDGQPIQQTGYFPINVCYTVSANCKNPEAIVKMLNLYTEVSNAATLDPNLFGQDPNDWGKNAVMSAIQMNYADKQAKAYFAITDALATNDPSKLSADQKLQYDEIMKFKSDPTYTAGWSANGYTTVFSKVWYGDTKTSDVLRNVWFAFPDADMATNNAQFKKMAEETITKIIYGTAPVSEWDTMVANWNQIYGDQELQKVIEAVAK